MFRKKFVLPALLLPALVYGGYKPPAEPSTAAKALKTGADQRENISPILKESESAF